jgi:hypothetical protein
MSRLNANGDEIGHAYQQSCIDSWRRAGFEPISVNSINEACSHSIRTIRVNRDASAIAGRALVFLADLLNVASIEVQDRPFALMNADLFMPPTSALAAKVAQLRAGEFIFSRRIDIDQPSKTDGVPYPFGYDFFAGHANDISGLSDAGLVFGMPWWDHYLPLLMFMQGRRIYQIEPAVLHLNHTERWSWAVWETLGQRFVAEVQACVEDKIYRSRLEDAIKRPTGRVISDQKYNLWPKNARGERRRILARVSHANLSFLDEMSLATGFAADTRVVLSSDVSEIVSEPLDIVSEDQRH